MGSLKNQLKVDHRFDDEKWIEKNKKIQNGKMLVRVSNK